MQFVGQILEKHLALCVCLFLFTSRGGNFDSGKGWYLTWDSCQVNGGPGSWVCRLLSEPSKQHLQLAPALKVSELRAG